MLRLIHKLILVNLLRIYRRHNTDGPRLFCLAGDHIGDEIFIEGLYESAHLRGLFNRVLADWLCDFRSGICLDVGANIGNHSAFFSPFFGRVFAFEPNPLFARVIEANLLLNNCNNVTLFRVGLGRFSRKVSYKQADHSNLGSSRFVLGADFCEGSLELEICRGDDLVGDCRVAFVKVDVEGFEEEVLEGLSGVILRDRPVIVFEAHPEQDYGQAERLLELVRRLGYNNICEFGPRRSESRGFFAKTFNRLRWGSRATLEPITQLERREYLMIVAVPS